MHGHALECGHRDMHNPKAPHFTDLTYSAEPMVFQRPNIELTVGTIILCVTKKKITCGLHHLLARHNTSTLMPVVNEPAALARGII